MTNRNFNFVLRFLRSRSINKKLTMASSSRMGLVQNSRGIGMGIESSMLEGKTEKIKKNLGLSRSFLSVMNPAH